MNAAQCYHAKLAYSIITILLLVNPVVVEAENNNKVHVCIEVESMDKLQEFMQIPDNAKVIEEAGVKLETQVMIPIIE